MKKSEIKEILEDAADRFKLVKAIFKFNTFYYNLIPLALSEKLFFVINEDDFILDGYSIFRFRDLTSVKVDNSIFDKILKDEEITSNIVVPDVDISDWKPVFESLKNMNRNIIVEKQSIDKDEEEFTIGRIEKVFKDFAYVWHFDAEGIWEDGPRKIQYSQITNVTFGSRYVDVFSRYIEEPPFVIDK